MAKRCKHNWVDVSGIVGDVQYPWMCCVKRICSKCQKQTERMVTDEEFEAEKVRLTCQRCFRPNNLHVDGDCVRLLASVVQELKRLLQHLENWRNS